MTMQRHR